ncbi:MAG: hypothetical protein SynsKO_14620 [Synoicihabitans sp.]
MFRVAVLVVLLLARPYSAMADGPNLEGKVMVQGEVLEPGVYDVADDETVMTLIVKAGGLSRLWGRSVRIIDGYEKGAQIQVIDFRRKGMSSEQVAEALAKIRVKPGTIVYFAMQVG